VGEEDILDLENLGARRKKRSREIPKVLVSKVLERDGYKCIICGKDSMLHIHHIIPWRQGGDYKMDNLVTLCSGCHGSVESGDVELAVYRCVLRAIKIARRTIKENIEQTIILGKKGPFKCGWCGMVFDDPQKVFNHLEKIHSDFSHRRLVIAYT
jgi:transcription elongation factor Elf1